MEYRIKKTAKKEYEVYIDDKLDKTFINLDLAMDYIKSQRSDLNVSR